MALITCPDCRQQISDSASACIQCGRPNRPLSPGAAPRPISPAGDSRRAGAHRQKQPTKWAVWLRNGAVAVVILIVLVWIAFGDLSEELTSVLRGLGTLAVGFAVVLSDDRPAAAPGNRRARKAWGDHFAAQHRQEEFHASLLIGGVLIAFGIVNLVLAGLDAAG